MLERFTTLLCRVGLSKSLAILLHISASCSLLLFFSSATSLSKTMFVGPVLFIFVVEFDFLLIIFYCNAGDVIRTRVPTKGLAPRASTFDQAPPPPRDWEFGFILLFLILQRTHQAARQVCQLPC